MGAAMPHADDELQSLPVVHAVLVRDLHMLIKERDLTGEGFQPLSADHELGNQFVTHLSSIVAR